MEFSTSKFECGGLITDEDGVQYLQTDNFNKIIPGLKCKFDFRAGIGFRYRIEFFFLNEDPDNHVSLLTLVNRVELIGYALTFLIKRLKKHPL